MSIRLHRVVETTKSSISLLVKFHILLDLLRYLIGKYAFHTQLPEFDIANVTFHNSHSANWNDLTISKFLQLRASKNFVQSPASICRCGGSSTWRIVWGWVSLNYSFVFMTERGNKMINYSVVSSVPFICCFRRLCVSAILNGICDRDILSIDRDREHDLKYSLLYLTKLYVWVFFGRNRVQLQCGKPGESLTNSCIHSMWNRSVTLGQLSN